MGDSGESGLTGQALNFLRIVQEGRSFSGRERHCCFLNLGDGRFADVSAISHFDFPDDGRAAALVDWDGDGDQDVWLSNRTSPQVRLLLNQVPSGHHFLALRLRGVRSNRDAIGARVKVVLNDGAQINRTLRAGDAFLSQSSKRMLIGLGDATSIDRVEVRWPAGQVQAFQLPLVDCEYRLVEGVDNAERTEPRSTVSLDTKDVAELNDSDASQSLCFSMIRFPAHDYPNLLGRRTEILSQQSRLVLVNLWASWCQPCVRELEEISAKQDLLKGQGIDVVALSVEGLTQGSKDGDIDVRPLQQMRFPFRSGVAEAALVEKLQLLHNNIFELHVPLPIPTSFLLDRRGRVVAVYKGAVTVERILADSSKLRAVKSTNDWRTATLPFAGRWVMPPRRRHLFQMVEQLADRGYFGECQQYVKDNQEMLTTHPRWTLLAKKIRDGPSRTVRLMCGCLYSCSVIETFSIRCARDCEAHKLFSICSVIA